MHAGMALAERGLFLAHAMAQALGGRYGAVARRDERALPRAGAALQRRRRARGDRGARDARSVSPTLPPASRSSPGSAASSASAILASRRTSSRRSQRRPRSGPARARTRGLRQRTTSRRSCARSGEVDESPRGADDVRMVVEYAGILAAVALMAATLTGAYGQTVSAVFASSTARGRCGRQSGEGAERLARRREDRLQARSVQEAGSEVPLRARLDRRHEEPGAVRPHAARARTPRKTKQRARCVRTRSSCRSSRSARSASRRPRMRSQGRRLSVRVRAREGCNAGREADGFRDLRATSRSAVGVSRPPMIRRRLTIPRIVSPSTTGRWRKPLSSITCAASSTSCPALR